MNSKKKQPNQNPTTTPPSPSPPSPSPPQQSSQDTLKTLISQQISSHQRKLPQGIIDHFDQWLLDLHYEEHTKKWQLKIKSHKLNLEDKELLEEVLLSASDSALSEWLQNRQETLTLRYSSPSKRPPAPAINLDEPAASSQVSAYERSRSKPLKNIGHIYCIASGKGGVGKSTVAVNLAVLLAQEGLRVGLLDADIHGPSAPELLGITQGLEVQEGEKVVPAYAHKVHCVSFGFLSDPQHPVVWRGPLISKALEQFLFDVAWGTLDYLIIDLPPGTGDIPMSLAENITLDGAVIVSTCHKIALVDAHKAISMFEGLYVPVIGLIGNMMSFQCHHCGEPSYVFGDPKELEALAQKRCLPILARLPLRPHLSATPQILEDPTYKKALTPALKSLRREHMEHL